ncbi:MAG: hypothetical protein PHU85_03330 [Phycisphaerae bacterium]|nr:hypothetical protein [Phycisphaerae bacterium]
MRTRTVLWATLCLAIALSLAAPALAADDPAKLAPDDTMLYVVVPNFQALFDKFKETTVYGLYREPAMQPCVAPAEKKINEVIDKGLSEVWSQIGLEKPPKELPWPQGRVTMILRLASVKRQFEMTEPAADGGPAQKKVHEYTDTEPQVVVLAEMGKNATALKDIIKKGVDKSVEDGEIRKVRETVRGIDVDVLTPKRDKKEVAPGSEPMPCIAWKDELLIAGSDLALLKDVITRMSGGGEQASLADDAGLKAVRAALPDPGQVMVYFSAKAAMDFAKKSAPANEKEVLMKTFSVLGLENVQGVGLTFEMAANKQIDFRARLQVAIRGEKTGIPALITPASSAVKPGPLCTRGLSGFLVANYDLAKVFDGIIKMIDAFGAVDSEKELQKAMEATRGQGDDGKPPVNLKKEVIGQLAPPLTLVFKHDRPFTATSGATMLLGLGVRDAKTLDAAIGRIHDVFLMMGNKELRRELLNTKIYLIPNILEIMMGGGGAEAKPDGLGLAVVGDQLVFGSVKWIEQCIREQGKEKGEGIEADPMYQHASKFLPAQAGLYLYSNSQVSSEALWVQLKEAAKQAAKGGKDSGRKPAMKDPADFGTGARPGNPAKLQAGMQPDTPDAQVPSIFLPLVEEVKDYIDFTTLPDFSAVKKYFGAVIWHLSGNDQGLYLEMLSVRPPGGE